MLFLLFGFAKVPEQSIEPGRPATTFSIIVPFRNEANNLPNLLSSLNALDYPRDLFQVLLVNDNSEDDSVEICEKFKADNPGLQVKLLYSFQETNAPKKDAIKTGIWESDFDYILTTDADCTVPETWLMAFNNFIGKSAADMVAGPVSIRSKKSILSKFQEIDFFSLQAATIGGFGIDKPFMCNGANLCYSKNRFHQVQGFQGNEEIASGDDIFLLEKFKAVGLKVLFLKDPAAIITTEAQTSLKNLIMQRVRWAAKTAVYQEFFPKAVGISVFLMNLLIVAAAILWVMGYEVKQYLFLSFLVKFNVDFVLIYRGAQFFGKENSMKNYFWASAVYPFFCCAVVIFSGLSGFQWKGRKFRK